MAPSIKLENENTLKITLPLSEFFWYFFSFCLDSFSLQLKLLVEQICFIENQVKDVKEEIHSIVEKMNTPLKTIPGIGDVTAAVILG